MTALAMEGFYFIPKKGQTAFTKDKNSARQEQHKASSRL